MKITVRKIAEEAGVSPASVSRYINGSEDVSSEIASKVESALFSLGGSPVVRRPRKQIILILLTHLRFDFYGRTLAELLEQEPQSEYTFMLLRYNPQSPETVRNFVSRMHPVGVIYFEEEIDSGILQYLQSCGLRTVMCGGVALDHQSDRVHVNDIAAAMNIQLNHFRWYAAFRDEGKHPHMHMIAWSTQPGEADLTWDGYPQYQIRAHQSDLQTGDAPHLRTKVAVPGRAGAGSPPHDPAAYAGDGAKSLRGS